MKRILDPRKIEEKSFEIIDQLLASSKLPRREKKVVQRVIHATTDVDYAKELLFHSEAVESGLKAIREGKSIVCDVSMVQSGINKTIAANFGSKLVCFINDAKVVKESRKLKIARAVLAVRKAVRLIKGAVVSIGNAPTALFELCDLVRTGKAKPALIIGVPVGFVGAAESKEELISLGVPYITNRGVKGGSSVACAITNALLHMARESYAVS